MPRSFDRELRVAWNSPSQLLRLRRVDYFFRIALVDDKGFALVFCGCRALVRTGAFRSCSLGGHRIAGLSFSNGNFSVG